jgi:hypothetical protein
VKCHGRKINNWENKDPFRRPVFNGKQIFGTKDFRKGESSVRDEVEGVIAADTELSDLPGVHYEE